MEEFDDITGVSWKSDGVIDHPADNARAFHPAGIGLRGNV
jgi:hypothetical protein